MKQKANSFIRAGCLSAEPAALPYAESLGKPFPAPGDPMLLVLLQGPGVPLSGQGWFVVSCESCHVVGLNCSIRLMQLGKIASPEEK